eukprot:jgi/Botrbrau1/14002/Bobra.150_1s0012.1
MAKAVLSIFLLALARTAFAEDFTATLSPSTGGASAEAQAPTGKLALTLDQDGKYTLTLSNIKDFTDAYLLVDGEKVFILRGSSSGGKVTAISIDGTTTFTDTFADKDLTGSVTSVSDLLSKVRDGKVTVVINTTSSPDGFLTGTVSSA